MTRRVFRIAETVATALLIAAFQVGVGHSVPVNAANPPSRPPAVSSPWLFFDQSSITQLYGCTALSAEPLPPDGRCNGNPNGPYWHTGIDIAGGSVGCGTQYYVGQHALITTVQVAPSFSGIEAQLDDSNYIVIYHSQASNVSPGNRYSAGAPFGVVGSYGNSTGCHIHFEIDGPNHTRGHWQDWTDIDPRTELASIEAPRAAAVSWGTQRVDLFVRGTDGGAWRRYTTDEVNWLPSGCSGSSCGPYWESLGAAGGGFDGYFSAASWGANRLDLFGIGFDGNLYHKVWSTQGWWPGQTTWENLGNGGIQVMGTPSAAAWDNNRLSVFARGIDGTLRHAYWSGSAWSWESHGGYLTSDPTVVSSGLDSLDVVLLGRDWGIWHQAWRVSQGWLPGPSLNNYDSWGTQGGRFAAQPTESYLDGGHIDVADVGADGSLWLKHFNGTTWGVWQSFAGSAGPGAVVGSPSFDESPTGVPLSIMVRATNGALWDCWPSGTTCNWQNHGGTLTSDPLLISAASLQEDVFGRALSPFYVAHQYYNGSGFGPYGPVPPYWSPGMTGSFDDFGGVMT